MRETMDERNEGLEIDLKKLLMVYLRKWWLILLCGFLVSCAVMLYTVKCVTPTYRSDVTVYVNNIRQNQQIDYLSESNLAASQRLVNTYITMIRSERVLGEVSRRLDGVYSVKDLAKMLSAEQVGETEIFRLYILHTDPAEAQRIANVLADVVPEEISALIEGSSARIVDYATLPESHFRPAYRKTAMLSGLAGCLLAVVYLTLQYLLDVRIKDGEDLMALVDYPILGQIPVINSGSTSSKKKYGYEPVAPTAGKGGDDE